METSGKMSGQSAQALNRYIAFLSDRVRGYMLLREADFYDLSWFAVKLRDYQDSVSAYLRWQLSLRTRQMLLKYDGEKPPEEELKYALLGDLNRLLMGEPIETPSEQYYRLTQLQCIYTPERFEDVDLGLEIRVWLKQPVTGEALFQLNRALLEQAYPHELRAYTNLPSVLTTLTSQEQSDIIARHQAWIEEQEGRKQLSSFRPPGSLQLICLTGADLSGRDLRGMNFQNADLRGANLSGANLAGADLTDADLRDTNLQNADLTDVIGLLPKQLAGADTVGAKLPEDIVQFEGLKNVEEVSKNAGKLYVSMLLGCIYAGLTIASTTDIGLLTNTASSKLPILNVDIPVTWFYIVCPVVLVAVYIYFHLYMQILWGELAQLPAVFPNGRPLHQKTYPWLLNDVARGHLERLRKERPFASRVQAGLAIVGAWGVVPLTLLYFWERFLCRHMEWGTMLHVACLTLAIGSGIWAYRHMVATLRGERRCPQQPEDSFARLLLRWLRFRRYGIGPQIRRHLMRKLLFLYRSGWGIAVLALMILFAGISHAAIHGVPADRKCSDGKPTCWEKQVPRLLLWCHINPFANLSQPGSGVASASVSLTDASTYKPVVLQGTVDLRYADARRALLVNASMEGIDLTGAKLLQANLTGANLHHAILRKSDLTKTILTGANLSNVTLTADQFKPGDPMADAIDKQRFPWRDFTGSSFANSTLYRIDFSGTDLTNADLSDAHLESCSFEKAILKNANLTGAHLTNACFRDADLSGAKLVSADCGGDFQLDEANLKGADLQSVNNLDNTELFRARNWFMALYSNDKISGLGLKSDHNEYIYKVSKNNSKAFQGYDFRSVDILHGKTDFNLNKTDFSGLDLTNACLKGASLDDTNFNATDLTGTDLSNAHLWGADLSGARHLGKAILQGAQPDHFTKWPGDFDPNDKKKRLIPIPDLPHHN